MNRFIKSSLILVIVCLVIVTSSAVLFAAKLSLSKEDVDLVVSAITSETGLSYVKVPEIKLCKGSDIRKVLEKEGRILAEAYKDKNYLFGGMKDMKGDILGKYSWLTNIVYLDTEVIGKYAIKLDIEPEEILKIIYTHEMVHALDDENFHLRDLFVERFDMESSQLLGILIEGHADYVSFRLYDTLGISSENSEKYRKIRLEEENILGSTFTKGVDFFDYILSQTEMTVTEIFAHPPIYAKQVQDPAVYVAGNYIPPTNLKEIMGPDFIEYLPWYFKKMFSRKIDYFTALIYTTYLGGDEKDVEGFVTSFSYRFLEETAKRPNNYGQETYIDSIPMGLFPKSFLQINITEFDSEKNADKYCDFVDQNGIDQIFPYPQKTTDFNDLQERYPLTYVKVYQKSKISTPVFLVNTVLHKRYVVDIITVALSMTEEQLIKILDMINERLNTVDAVSEIWLVPAGI